MDERQCHEMFRMDKQVFSLFCVALVKHGLECTKHIRVEEMVAMFLHILGVSNRVIQERFQHSSETINGHFHNVLIACLKLSFKLIRP